MTTLHPKSAIEIINDRRIILGPSDNLRAAYPLKYPWTADIWATMKDNNWYPSEVNLSRDKAQYPLLSSGERLMYNRALAFLSNLDNLQLENLVTHIGRKITSPEVSRLINRQVYEEEVHVESYSRMVENTVEDPLDIYYMATTDELLSKKNAYILAQAKLLDEGEFTPEKFYYAVISNILLEGVFFFSGFLDFYTLARQGKMLGSADMIKFIQRDEIVHLHLFLCILQELKKEFPDCFQGYAGKVLADNARDLIDTGVNLEIAWGCHTIEGGVLGLTNKIVEGHIKTIADNRAMSAGLGTLYNVTNPVPWFEKFSMVNGSDTNNFERRPTDYRAGGSLEW